MANYDKTCSFTGHRPEYLPWGDNEKSPVFKCFKKRLEQEIIKAIENGYDNFISGMSEGIDLIATEIIIKLKKKYKIYLSCAIPFEGFENKMTDKWLLRFNTALKHADDITYVNNGYNKYAFYLRNKFLVEHSSMLIAFCIKNNSGTKQTIDLAKRLNKQVVNIEL